MNNFKYKIIFISITIFMIFSCRTTPPGGDVSACPTVEQEPVSNCRAEAKCKAKKTQYSVGLGYGIQARENLAPHSQEMSMARSPTTDNYTNCIQQSLKEQAAHNKNF